MGGSYGSPYIFIGASGVGKSVVGERVARKLGYIFIDSDRVMEGREGKSIQEVLEEGGVEGYLGKERAAVEWIRGEVSKRGSGGVVFSTGGSACYFPEEVKRFGGTVVYIQLSLKGLRRRIKNFSGRAFIQKRGSLEEEYYYRERIYEEMAELRVESDGLLLEEVVEKIYGLIEGREGRKDSGILDLNQ